MVTVVEIGLGLSALYCAGMWLYLAQYSIRHGADLEAETFHLGLCFVLSAGFLGLLLK